MLVRHDSVRLGLLLGTLAWLAAPANGQEPYPFDSGRLMADVQRYYGFGVHRTAYPGDVATSAWLTQRFRALGLDTSAHTFTLRQFFPEQASIEDSRGRIEAFPIWLPRTTPPEGLTRRLVVVEETTPPDAIRGAIAWLQPSGGTAVSRAALDRKAIEAGAAAIIFATSDGAGLGVLQAVNAARQYVDTARPVPTLIFGTAEADRLRQSVGREITVRLTGRMVEDAEATNVIGRRIVDEEADWIVVSTPSSGWFTCAGERGPGVAMLLALAEWVRTRSDGLNYLFVATSGHELDYLGARLFHESGLAPPSERTRAWVHLGAQIATPPWQSVDGVLSPTSEVTTGTLQASDELADVMRAAFEELPMFALRTDTRVGEFRDLVEHGYRGVGVVGGSNPWFHVQGDDPRAISPAVLAAVTGAVARALDGLERIQP